MAQSMNRHGRTRRHAVQKEVISFDHSKDAHSTRRKPIVVENAVSTRYSSSGINVKLVTPSTEESLSIENTGDTSGEIKVKLETLSFEESLSPYKTRKNAMAYGLESRLDFSHKDINDDSEKLLGDSLTLGELRRRCKPKRQKPNKSCGPTKDAVDYSSIALNECGDEIHTYGQFDAVVVDLDEPLATLKQKLPRKQVQFRKKRKSSNLQAALHSISAHGSIFVALPAIKTQGVLENENDPLNDKCSTSKTISKIGYPEEHEEAHQKNDDASGSGGTNDASLSFVTAPEAYPQATCTELLHNMQSEILDLEYENQRDVLHFTEVSMCSIESVEHGKHSTKAECQMVFSSMSTESVKDCKEEHSGRSIIINSEVTNPRLQSTDTTDSYINVVDLESPHLHGSEEISGIIIGANSFETTTTSLNSHFVDSSFRSYVDAPLGDNSLSAKKSFSHLLSEEMTCSAKEERENSSSNMISHDIVNESLSSPQNANDNDNTGVYLGSDCVGSPKMQDKPCPSVDAMLVCEACCTDVTVPTDINRQKINRQCSCCQDAKCLSPPKKLLSNRKVLSPTSQEKFYQWIDSEELYESMKSTGRKRSRFERTNSLSSAPNCTEPYSGLSSESVIKKARNGRISIHPSANKSILKSPLSSCSKSFSCEESSSVSSHSQDAIKFSQQQMRDIETITMKLVAGIKSMKNVMTEALNLEAFSSAPTHYVDQIKASTQDASELEITADKYMAMMARDFKRFCKIMRSKDCKAAIQSINCLKKRRKITFADEAGGMLCQIKVIEDDLNSCGSPGSDGAEIYFSDTNRL